MGRRLPPFAAVRAFEAAARCGSFKAAAEELCLSPSAVSHQIRALEAYLDTLLFERRGQGVRLTFTGQAYAGRLTSLLDGLDAACREVSGEDDTLRVLSTPGFAARWLVPRLERLGIADQLRLRVSTGAPSLDFATNDADVVIQWADMKTPGLRVVPFLRSARYPIISPRLLATSDLDRPEKLLSMRLIRDETDDGWGAWFTRAGVDAPRMPSGPVHPNCELATTEVEQGRGVSLAYDAVVRGTVAAGRVVRLFEAVTSPANIYSLAWPEARDNAPLIRAFSGFIEDEMRSEPPETRVSVPA